MATEKAAGKLDQALHMSSQLHLSKRAACPMLARPVHDTVVLQCMLQAGVSSDMTTDSHTSMHSCVGRFLKRLKMIQTSMKRETMLLVKTLMMQKMTRGE